MAVVRRTAMEWSARTRGRVVLPEDFTEWAERLADEVETDGVLLAAEETALVARAYGSLPERWQVLLWCFVVKGEPAATVAQRMGMTPSGVRSLAARARAGRTRARTWTRTPPPEYRCRTPLPTGTARRPGRRRAPACHSGECPPRGRVAGDFRRADRRPEGEAPWRAGPEPVRSCRAGVTAERRYRTARARGPLGGGRRPTGAEQLRVRDRGVRVRQSGDRDPTPSRPPRPRRPGAADRRPTASRSPRRPWRYGRPMCSYCEAAQLRCAVGSLCTARQSALPPPGREG